MPTIQPYFDFSEKEIYQRCVNIFCKHCKLENGDTVIDIGAGVGTEVCYFTDQIGTNGNLYNLEASPSSYKTLKTLTEKNRLKNCHNFNLAISNSQEPIWMEEGDNYVVNTVNKEAKGVLIQATTLDQFIVKNSISSIKLLKVNIEGAEFDMIDGMTEAINIIENVAISCHDFLFNKDPLIRDKVVSFLTANQFEIFYENTGNKVLDSWIYGKKIVNQ
jgi:FkbM family methyltransferase